MTGEWIIHTEDIFTPDRLTPITRIIRECPFCHKKIWFDGKMNFCLECGADLRDKAIDKHISEKEN